MCSAYHWLSTVQADAEEDLKAAVAALAKEERELAASTSQPEALDPAGSSAGKPRRKAVIDSESETEVVEAAGKPAGMTPLQSGLFCPPLPLSGQHRLATNHVIGCCNCVITTF